MHEAEEKWKEVREKKIFQKVKIVFRLTSGKNEKNTDDFRVENFFEDFEAKSNKKKHIFGVRVTMGILFLWSGLIVV